VTEGLLNLLEYIRYLLRLLVDLNEYSMSQIIPLNKGITNGLNNGLE